MRAIIWERWTPLKRSSRSVPVSRISQKIGRGSLEREYTKYNAVVRHWYKTFFLMKLRIHSYVFPPDVYVGFCHLNSIRGGCGGPRNIESFASDMSLRSRSTKRVFSLAGNVSGQNSQRHTCTVTVALPTLRSPRFAVSYSLYTVTTARRRVRLRLHRVFLHRSTPALPSCVRTKIL